MAARTDEISLVDLVEVLTTEWRTIAAITATFMVASVVLALVLTPIYRAEVVIAEVTAGPQGRESGAAALLGTLGGLSALGVGLPQGRQQEGQTILQSRSFLERFIEMNDLMPLLLTDEWDSEVGDWRSDLPQVPLVWQAAEVLREHYGLRTDIETGLITLSVDWPDAETASAWANGLIALADNIARARDISEAERSIAYLNEQAEKTNVVELRSVLYRLLETEQQTLMLANAREEYAFRVVDPAVAPIKRAKPNRRLIVVLGVIGGIFAGLFVVFVRRLKASLAARRLTAE